MPHVPSWVYMLLTIGCVTLTWHENPPSLRKSGKQILVEFRSPKQALSALWWMANIGIFVFGALSLTTIVAGE